MSIDQHCENTGVRSFFLGIGSYLIFPTVRRITQQQNQTLPFQTGETLTGIVTLTMISYGLTEIAVHHNVKYYLATGATLLATNVLSEFYEWARENLNHQK